MISWSKVKEGEQTQEEAKQEELRNQNVEALLELSATKLNVVAAALCTAFNQLPEVREILLGIAVDSKTSL